MTNFAARVTPKLFGLHPSNFTGMLSSLTCGAPPYFELSPLDDFGVIAPDKLKFHINYVSPILKMGRHIVFARVVCLSVRLSVRLSVTNFAARVTQKP